LQCALVPHDISVAEAGTDYSNLPERA
jgi:hypothetical protein